MRFSSWKWIRKHKWMLLLIGIVTLLLISPISEVYDRQDNLITPLTAIVFLAVVLGTTEKRIIIWSLASLTMFWLIVSTVTDGSGLFAGQSLAAPLLFMVLLVSIFLLLARWLVRVVIIDSEVLCAAICGYLLLGILWTGFYAVIVLVNPGAFISSIEPKVQLGDMLYFSFTTLTTTGFGDILPKDAAVRMFAVLEAVVGIFYNAIVIARFVGLYGLQVNSPGASNK